MSSVFTKLVLTSTLLVAQLLGSVAAVAFGQCSEGSCCCSLDAKESGTCCCNERLSSNGTGEGSCCHVKDSRTTVQFQICACGCQSDSRPTAPNQRSNDLREEVQRTASEPAELSDFSLLSADARPTIESGLQRNTFYSGVSQQPLYCAWLL